jgi:hypothetical protein
MGDTPCCQRRSFDRAAPLATSKADRSEHRVQYRANQPDAARLDFATVAAYEDDYFPWEGGGLLGREVPVMPTFVTLAKWTDEGIRNITSKNPPSALRPSKTGSPQREGR